MITAIGRFGGALSSGCSILNTIPGAPLYSPTSCHRFAVSMTVAPLVRSNVACSPPASSELEVAATLLLCKALMRAIGFGAFPGYA